MKDKIFLKKHIRGLKGVVNPNLVAAEEGDILVYGCAFDRAHAPPGYSCRRESNTCLDEEEMRAQPHEQRRL